MIPFGIDRKCVLFDVSLYTLYPLLFNRSYSNFGTNTETEESILDVVEEEEEDECKFLKNNRKTGASNHSDMM